MDTPELRQVTPEEHWQITCHEAGHGIVGIRLQLPIIAVERGQGEHGEVTVGVGPTENPSKNWVKDEISGWQQFYAAGAAAELLLFGDYRKYAASRDRRLYDILEKQWFPNRSGGWEQDIQSAMKLLDRESVEKVARALERQKKLSEEQVCDMLGVKPPWW